MTANLYLTLTGDGGEMPKIIFPPDKNANKLTLESHFGSLASLSVASRVCKFNILKNMK